MTSDELIRLAGFEFMRRNSGSAPLQYRPEGGCQHDWVWVEHNSPVLALFNALAAAEARIEAVRLLPYTEHCVTYRERVLAALTREADDE